MGYVFTDLSKTYAGLTVMFKEGPADTSSTIKDFNRHQFFSTNKQYVKIKLMQNEKNRCSNFFCKDEILIKL